MAALSQVTMIVWLGSWFAEWPVDALPCTGFFVWSVRLVALPPHPPATAARTRHDAISVRLMAASSIGAPPGRPFGCRRHFTSTKPAVGFPAGVSFHSLSYAPKSRLGPWRPSPWRCNLPAFRSRVDALPALGAKGGHDSRQ